MAAYRAQGRHGVLRQSESYRLLRDTVYKTRTDTIPVVKQVPVIRKERYTPPFTKFLACLGIIALGASVIVLLGKKLKS